MAQYDASSVSYRMVNIPSRASLLQRALLRLPTLTTPAPVPQSIKATAAAAAVNDMMHMRKKAKSHVHDIDVSNYSVYRDLCGRMPSDISSLIIEYTITHDILQLGAIYESYEMFSEAYQCYSRELYSWGCPLLGSKDGREDKDDDDDKDDHDPNAPDDDYANIYVSEWRCDMELRDEGGFLAYKLALYYDYAPVDSFPSSTLSSSSAGVSAAAPTGNVTSESNDDDNMKDGSKGLVALQWYRSIALLQYIRYTCSGERIPLLSQSSNTPRPIMGYVGVAEIDLTYCIHSANMAQTLLYNQSQPYSIPSQRTRADREVDDKQVRDPNMINGEHWRQCDQYDYPIWGEARRASSSAIYKRWQQMREERCKEKKQTNEPAAAAEKQLQPSKKKQKKPHYGHGSDDDDDSDDNNDSDSEWRGISRLIRADIDQAIKRKDTGEPALIGWRGYDAIDAWAHLGYNRSQEGTNGHRDAMHANRYLEPLCEKILAQLPAYARLA